ncbi:hypothetical protein BDN72DRAFT_834196 [Pluteus cervinus]|uniref:Uncharacterized protein n=1 Tax=Pluteus cervinus TaxID=181527 RepID=A0ACD3B7P5_9AGAR|nr:hypothetical protein BDN72DRAFT_834196 [Pluteus cervinus]
MSQRRSGMPAYSTPGPSTLPSFSEFVASIGVKGSERPRNGSWSSSPPYHPAVNLPPSRSAGPSVQHPPYPQFPSAQQQPKQDYRGTEGYLRQDYSKAHSPSPLSRNPISAWATPVSSGNTSSPLSAQSRTHVTQQAELPFLRDNLDASRTPSSLARSPPSPYTSSQSSVSTPPTPSTDPYVDDMANIKSYQQNHHSVSFGNHEFNDLIVQDQDIEDSPPSPSVVPPRFAEKHPSVRESPPRSRSRAERVRATGHPYSSQRSSPRLPSSPLSDPTRTRPLTPPIAPSPESNQSQAVSTTSPAPRPGPGPTPQCRYQEFPRVIYSPSDPRLDFLNDTNWRPLRMTDVHNGDDRIMEGGGGGESRGEPSYSRRDSR